MTNTTETKTETKAKAANYTEAQVLTLVTTYEAAKNDAERVAAIDSLVKSLGKNKRSIVAKLSREGVYIKAAPTAKNGQPMMRKSDLVQKIAAAIDEQEEVLESLEKATKTALCKLLAFLEAKKA